MYNPGIFVISGFLILKAFDTHEEFKREITSWEFCE